MSENNEHYSDSAKFTEELVTPDRAALFLINSIEYTRLQSLKPDQGPVSHKNDLNSYIQAVKAGKSEWNSENSIEMNADDQVVSGFALLEACVHTGITIKVTIRRT